MDNSTDSLARLLAGTVISQSAVLALLIRKGLLTAPEVTQALEAELKVVETRPMPADAAMAFRELLSVIRATFPQK